MKPSDDDLNVLLKTWTAPRSPDSLGERLRRAYRERTGAVLLEVTPPRVRLGWITRLVPRIGRLAGVVAFAVILLAVITRAFPQSLGFLAPAGAITIDEEYLDYKDDGSYTVREYRTTSFSPMDLDTPATILSNSFPGDPLRTAAAELLNPVRAILDPVMHRAIDPLFYKPNRARAMRALAENLAARARNGCVPSPHWGTPMTVIGTETVLNYTTTRFEYEFNDERFGEWLAPALDCFSVRSTTEKVRPDGTFRLESERRVATVTKNSGTNRPN